jgi:hypothetical protein
LRLDSLRSSIDAIERRNPAGVPTAIYGGYAQFVSEYNALVRDHNGRVDRLRALDADYSKRVDQFNALVAEAKGLAEKIGSPWYVVPLPRAAAQHAPATLHR